MQIYVIFVFYLLFLWTAAFLTGLNFVRFRETFLSHPRPVFITFALAFNYAMSQFVFYQISSIISGLFACSVAYFIILKLEKVRIIGITGGIATGKSTLTKMIKSNFKNFDIIDCDEISRNLRKKGEPGYKIIKGMLGDNFSEYVNPLTLEIDEDGREKLNRMVFNNEEFRKKLTRSMGKVILLNVFKRIIKNILTGQKEMVVDAPLLFESKILEYVCFPVVLVGCSEETQIDRLMKRDGYTEEEALNRIRKQMPLKEKMKRTKFYISNEDSEEGLIKEFSARIQRYLSEKTPMDYVIELKQKKDPKVTD